MKQFTKEEAIAFHDSGAWQRMSHFERAAFQTAQDKLCMPFSTYHEAMTKALGRPVYTHEFCSSNHASITKELLGERQAPTFDEVLALIPADKLIICASHTSPSAVEAPTRRSTMATVRAKFTVNSVTRRKNWDKSKGDLFDVALSPVTGNSEENKKFFEATPGGQIVLSTINEDAAAALPLGGEVYVDFTPVEAPAAA